MGTERASTVSRMLLNDPIQCHQAMRASVHTASSWVDLHYLASSHSMPGHNGSSGSIIKHYPSSQHAFLTGDEYYLNAQNKLQVRLST